jgi:hypothetical protein
MQKIFTFDYIEFVRWTELIASRKTFVGKLKYYLGKIVAIWYLIRLFFSSRNIVYPVYKTDRIS